MMPNITKLASALCLTFSGAAIAQAPTPADFFTNAVKPILEANCFACPGGRPSVKGEFRITSQEGLAKETTRGPAINRENPAESAILQMISYVDEQHQMPPKGKLAQEDIDTLTQWVAMGAPWAPDGEDF